MELTFRPASKADIPPLMDILTKATEYKLAHHDAAWGSEPYTHDEVALSLEAGTTYVARHGGEVIGTVMLQWEDKMWGEEDDGKAGYLHRLAIKEDLHGQGIGAQIMDWAARETAKRGRQYLRLDCPADNASLCRYYEENGFKRVDTKPNPMIPGYTAAYFERAAS